MAFERLNGERGKIVAEYLVGTAKSLEEGIAACDLPEDLIDNSAFLGAIDDAIFMCERCGWWCEQYEANENPNGGDDICDDCKDEIED